MSMRFRSRSPAAKLTALGIVAVMAGWSFVAKPAMLRAQEWTGTVISKDTGRSFFSSRRHRRTYYYLIIDTDDGQREVEVPWDMYNDARKGERAVKVKGELYPRLP